MFFSLSIPQSIFSNTPSDALGLLNIQTRGDFCETELHENKLFILLGRIYEKKSSSLSHLAEILRASPSPNTLHGRFLFIELNWADKSVHLHIDKYRLLNPLHFKHDGYLWLGNQFSHLPRAAYLQRDELSETSLKELGVVIYPHTLLKDVEFVTGDALWIPEDGSLTLRDHATEWSLESRAIEGEIDVSEWIDVFQNSMAELIENWRPHIIRMSGGIDTRLISLLIPKDYVPQIQAQVLCHPQLAPEVDRDVLGAKLIADLLNFKLTILQPEIADYNYVGGLESPYSLSGLYGGEFFGGLMYKFSPLSEILEKSASAMTAHPHLQTRLAELGLRNFTTELFLSAFRSTIYKSTSRSWSSPWELNQCCLSLFVEQRVLDHLLLTPFEEVAQYKLYARIFRTLAPNEASLPLSSPITQLQDGFYSFQDGIEPKSLPSGAEGREDKQETRSIGEQNLENFHFAHTRFFSDDDARPELHSGPAQ